MMFCLVLLLIMLCGLRYMTFSFQLHVEYINCYFFVLQAMITLISKNFSVPIAEAMKYYKDKHLPS